MLIVSDHIVTVDPTDPNAPKEDELPTKGKVIVLFKASTGVKEVKTKGTTYAKNGTVFQDEDFPQDITFEDGYEGPVTWTPKNKTVKTDKFGNCTFKASATLKDIIDRTDDPTKPTPEGYVRVTFTNGDGVNEIANNKVYDVKIGTKLPADKYPEVTAKDGYENPTWSTPAGTAITKDNATITATATEKAPAEADNETYTATGGEIEKKYGEATTEAEVLGKVTTDYPADAATQPTKALKAGQTLPDGKTSGNFDVVVEVTYPDGTVDEATVRVKVAKSNAETYEPEVSEETVKKGGTVDLTDNVTNLDKLPEGTKVEDITPEGTMDTNTPGKYTGKVKVTYPDGTFDEKDVPVTVTDTTTPAEKDADKYEPEVKKEEIEKGGTVDLTDNVTNLDKLPEGTTVEDVTPEGAIDTNTPGDYTGKIKVTYPDGSSEEKEVPVTVKDTTPSEDDTKVTGNVNPVDPTDEKQDTGINVENPDKDTNISAKDEDGKDIPVEIDKDGNVIVTPGTDVDGPITVVVEDPDLPGGKVVIEVPVIGHEKGRDDNCSGDHGYIPGDNDYFFPGGFKRHDYTPTYPVKTVVPEKTQAATPVRDTLWYVFHINEFEYEVVRNGVVTKRLMDVTPVLQNGRTMLPLRYVAEAIGAEVKWDKKTRTATFIKDGLTASIQIDSDEIVLSNGKTVKMDSKPLNINDRILVSVTNVANVFGLTNGNTQDKIDQDIEWEQEDKSATIYIRR